MNNIIMIVICFLKNISFYALRSVLAYYYRNYSYESLNKFPN
jgi:hypothetical protein